ncbi:MAG TPA: hypothetical protein PLC53_02920 [Bacilli bacterium]|nr:hypothetical protein [Bacilli bacterium]
MREAIGGALLIKLVMFFIVIYVCFLAIAINYSITFRVKNQIINLIESYEGYDLAREHIEDYIADVGHYKTSVGTVSIGDGTCDDGYCIEPISVSRDGDVVGYYYKVTTYVTFDFPIIGQITNFPVSGETRVIYTV